MSSPEEAKSIFVTVEVPSVEQLSDDNLAALAHMRDGRWSAQTKALLKRFGTGKLDLNSGWASTWTLWSCPCCRREKAQIARLSGSGVLLCRLEFHHDHLADFAKRIFSEHNQRSEDQETNIQIGRAKDALMLFVERFERTLICIDCNLAEGRAKLELAKEIDSNFTFSPSQIASFIGVAPNRVHSIDIEKARVVWLAAKDDVADRLDFTARMAQRIASGRHRREVAAGRRLFAQIQERDLIYSLFSRAAPDGYRHRLGAMIEARSTANDSAGRSLRAKRKAQARPPTDAEFAEIDHKQQEHKPWVLAGVDWICPCCDRSKREICRKSNRGLWTAHIHRVCEYEREDRDESLVRRRVRATSQIVIGSHRHLLCQDCRNVTSEVLRRTTGLTEDILPLADLQQLVGGAMPHAVHDIDFDQAIAAAIGNKPLIEAIEDYRDHRSRSLEALTDVKRLMKLMGWPWHQARDIIGYEYAKSNDIDLEDGDAQADWLLDEAARLVALDEFML
ncbi:MAG: hypothetical protein ACREEK_24370 [Bradyrhizobium sp.]